MDYEGIRGQAADKNNRGLIDIEDLAWNVSRKITSSTSTHNDRESANAVIGDLTLTRRMDSTSPYLFIESCCGKGRTVTIRLTKTGAGTGGDVFMEYTLKNALLKDYRVKAMSQSNLRPMELLKISFVDLEVKYTPYDEDGNAMAPIAVGFNTATNEKR
jgi:type VI secretion system secreted protein Hcp